MDLEASSSVWTRWFWLFALTHVIVWSLMPILTAANAPLDTIEMIYWGNQWQWGYYKHPPLPAWLAAGTSGWFSDPAWASYIVAQACILACIWAVWEVVRDRNKPWIALAAAALLEACAFYNYTTIELNNNMVRRAMTALTVVFLYWAITKGRLAYWTAAGVFVALGLLSKYDHGMLVLSLVAFAAIHPQVRGLWKTPGPYVLIGVSLLLFAPHAWWMIENDFITLKYIQDRTQTEPNAWNHLIMPAKFLGEQLGAIAGMLIGSMALLGFIWKWRTNLSDEDRLARDYLLAVVVGPLSIAVFASLATGGLIRSMLGAPIWIFLPALLVMCFERRRQDPLTCGRVAVGCACLSIVFAIVVGTRNTYGTAMREKYLRVDYPGDRLADEVQLRWQSVADAGQPPTIAGSWWPAGNASVYADRPIDVYPECDPHFAPWIDESKIQDQGGVIVWEDPDDQPAHIAQWLSRFPTAIVQKPIEIQHVKAPEMTPLKIGIAVIPPSHIGTDKIPPEIATSATSVVSETK
ncbi:glycosyltransferase family 39 protein [Bremerella sp. P1]|uniref:glycosyltransferase family 39 protein n=1 Tax=Bremerella sp. P1 TaxID=3026424 RepID=UPI002368D7A1|nr:glycosyltransferase family 39 protein [Bremerella sp. P1]WDI44492.1 glycosyltransferase family 39 protein [Bremerella sp. P1]